MRNLNRYLCRTESDKKRGNRVVPSLKMIIQQTSTQKKKEREKITRTFYWLHFDLFDSTCDEKTSELYNYEIKPTIDLHYVKFFVYLPLTLMQKYYVTNKFIWSHGHIFQYLLWFCR